MSNARNVLSKKELAELCGVKPSAISNMISRGSFSGAVSGTGERARINIDHEKVQAYIQKRMKNKKPKDQEKKPAPKKVRPSKVKVEDENDPYFTVPEEIRGLLDTTLREMVDLYGGQTGFKDFLEQAKKIEDIHTARLKNATTEGDLVRRDIVKRGILEPINSAHIKLITDGSRSIAKEVFGLVKAGQDEDEVSRIVKSRIESFIRPIKEKIIKSLEEA